VFKSERKTLVVKDGILADDPMPLSLSEATLSLSEATPTLGRLALNYPGDISRDPELAFKLGVGVGLALAKKEQLAEGHCALRPMHEVARTLKAIAAVECMAARAQLLASAGGALHLSAARGDSGKLKAVLECLERCSCCCLEHHDALRFKAGDRVILAEGYESISDAAGGPLSPFDVGTVTEVRYDNGDRVHVNYLERQWWYNPEALLRFEEAGCRCDRCRCYNCVNRRDRQGRTALHIASIMFVGHSSLRVLEALIEKGARLHGRADDGSTALHCLLRSPAVLGEAKPPVALLRAVDALSNGEVFQSRAGMPSPIVCAVQSDAPNAVLVLERMTHRLQELENDSNDSTEDASLSKVLWHKASDSKTGACLTVLEFALKRLDLASSPHHRQAAALALSRLLSASMVKQVVHHAVRFCALNKEIADVARSCGVAMPADAALAAIGFAWNAGTVQSGHGQSIGPPFTGVKKGISLRRFLKDGWRVHYQETYANPTYAENLENIPKAKWVMVAARQLGSDKLLLAAVARRHDVLKKTAEGTHLANGVYWYLCPRKAFGFASHPSVLLRAADTCDEKGDDRLSWHLTGQGGWRAGMIKRLVTGPEAQRFEKLILYSGWDEMAGPLSKRDFDLFQGRKVALDDDALEHTFDGVRRDGSPCQVLGSALGVMTLVEAGTGGMLRKWRVASGDVRCWVDSNRLRPLGAGFPRHVCLAACNILELGSSRHLSRLGSFPLQAIQYLSLADNLLANLPEDFATSFPLLESLDIAGNR